MLRNILMLCPALAFALPFVVANPTLARPLANAEQPARWCWGDNDCGDDEDVFVQLCTATVVFVQTGDDDRSYKCELKTGPECLASCALADDAGACRSACEGGASAGVCSPVKSRWGDWDWEEVFDEDDRDDDDREDFDEENIVFVGTETCLEIDSEN